MRTSGSTLALRDRILYLIFEEHCSNEEH